MTAAEINTILGLGILFFASTMDASRKVREKTCRIPRSHVFKRII
jgi:hypothetical protein